MFISWRCTLFAVRAGDLRWPAALSGCTTVFDHAYVFQNGCRIDDQIAAAAELNRIQFETRS